MTDKELRKLSRLELLELLLESSKENSKLKEKIDSLTAENKTTQNIENLSVITRQVESALKYANSLTGVLESVSNEVASSDSEAKKASNNRPKKSKTCAETDPLSDVEIYRRMLSFFARNDDKLNVFPADIENDVRARINSILEKRKSN